MGRDLSDCASFAGVVSDRCAVRNVRLFLSMARVESLLLHKLNIGSDPIIYGVIVSVSEYPPVFKVFSQIFPFYNVRDYLQTGQWEHLAIEGIKLVVLIIVTGLVYQLKHKKVVDKKGLLF